MSSGRDYFGAPAVSRTPGVITATRVLLYILAAAAAIGLISGLAEVRSAFTAGLVFGAEVPGIVALVLAVVMRPGRAWMRWAVVVDCAVYVLMAAGTLRAGSPLGFAQMALPIALLVLVNVKTGREYFRRR